MEPSPVRFLSGLLHQPEMMMMMNDDCEEVGGMNDYQWKLMY
jgi:hypothetical protein